MKEKKKERKKKRRRWARPVAEKKGKKEIRGVGRAWKME